MPDGGASVEYDDYDPNEVSRGNTHKGGMRNPSQQSRARGGQQLGPRRYFWTPPHQGKQVCDTGLIETPPGLR